MASPKGKAGKKAGFAQFAIDAYAQDFDTLRQMAMNYARRLERMLPDPEGLPKGTSGLRSMSRRDRQPEFQIRPVMEVHAQAPAKAEMKASSIEAMLANQLTQRLAAESCPNPRLVSTTESEFALLLGGRDGIIDGFGKLARLIILLSDKEKESSGPSTSAANVLDEFDDDELDRQIAAELDRIAARHAETGFPKEAV